VEDYNRLIIEQINRQLKSGFDSSLRTDKYCVVKTGIGGILSVLPENSISNDNHTVSGPDTFAACIQYVNTYFVSEFKGETKDPAKPSSATSDEESDEENQA
jgi:hypothetical protein